MGRFITGAGYAGTIGGNITVFGTSERQIISVADVAGTVTFDPSFNKGGDTIVLAKSAAAYTINQSGSTVVLSDGDSRIVIPLGIVASTIQFSDGDRTLLFSGGVKIGSQVVTATAATVTAEGTAKSTLAADAAAQAARLVLNGESAWVGGNATVYGSAGVENVSIVGAGKITFDPSFNRGGDTVSFSASAQRFSATKSASSVSLTHGQTNVVLPIGIVGLDVIFAGDARTLKFSNGAFLLGADTLAASGATSLSAKTIVSQSFEKVVSASLDAKLVSWDWEALGVYDINGDGRKDVILANGGDGTFPGWKADLIPATPNDLITTVLFGNDKGELQKVNSSGIGVIGWVNDWIYLPKQNGPGLYIVGIDHGREVPLIPSGNPDPQYESKLVVIDYSNGQFTRNDSAIIGNYKNFWHNAWQVGDLNRDGLDDFVVAAMDSFGVFYGIKNGFSRLSADLDFFSPGESVIGSVGASAILDIGGDGDLDFVLLPYSSDWNPADIRGDIFQYQNGSPFFNLTTHRYSVYLHYQHWANTLEPVVVTATVNGNQSKFDSVLNPVGPQSWITGMIRISSDTPINKIELAVSNSFIKMLSVSYDSPNLYESISIASGKKSNNLTAEWAKSDWTLTGDSLIFQTSETTQSSENGVYYFDKSSDVKLNYSSFIATLEGTPKNYGYVSARVADINGDGLDDVVGMIEARDGANQYIIAVMIQNKSNSFDVKYVVENNSFLLGPRDFPYSNDPKFQIFDLDRDGNLDIVWNMRSGTSNYLPNTIYYGDGLGNFQKNVLKTSSIFKDVNWEGKGRTMMEDFNGDGLPDLLVLTYNSITVTPIIFYNNAVIG
jgi:hypothetical protein